MIAPTQGLHGTGLLGQAAGPAARRAQARSHRAESVKLPLPRPQPSVTLPEVRPAAAVQAHRHRDGIRPAHPARRRNSSSTVTRRLPLEPGHQVVLTLPGFPAVTLSPTLRVDGSAELNELVFHLAPRSRGARPRRRARRDDPARRSP